MRNGKVALIPLVVAMFAANAARCDAQERMVGAGASVTVVDHRLEMLATTPQIYPNPVRLYGHQSYALATPMSSRLDNYYSGAVSRPRGNLNCWYGNGYDW